MKSIAKDKPSLVFYPIFFPSTFSFIATCNPPSSCKRRIQLFAVFPPFSLSLYISATKSHPSRNSIRLTIPIQSALVCQGLRDRTERRN